MHIKLLHIKNFKSHADTLIEFDQITSITGRNDCGKTNILRALKMLLHHTDWPTSWIRYGEDSASVKLELTDGTIVERKRSLKSQSVIVTKKDGLVTIFEGKKDATDYIEKVVGIRKVTLDESTGPEDLNFVDVHDGPYLLGGRSDTVQRKVAGIVGANRIDDARNRLIKRAKKLETKVEELKVELDSLSPGITRDRAIVQRCLSLRDKIQDLNKEWNDSHNKLQEFQKICDHKIKITSSIITDNVVANMSTQIEVVREIKKRLIEVTRSLDSCIRFHKEIPSQLRSTRFSTQIRNRISKLRNEFVNTNNKLDSANKISKALNLSLEECQEAQEELTLAGLKFESLKKQKTDYLDSLTICPMCGKEK